MLSPVQNLRCGEGPGRMDRKKLLIVCMPGRLGDIVAAEPAFRRLREMYPDRHFVWYTKKNFAGIFRSAPFPDETVTFEDTQAWLAAKASLPPDAVVYEFNLRLPRDLAPSAEKKFRDPGMKLLYNFIAGTEIKLEDDAPRFHIDETAEAPEISGKYVVFHCASGGKHRQWQTAKLNTLATQVIRQGFEVVELGIVPVLTLKDPGVIRLSGRQDIHTAAKLIRGADLFVGVESGFAHIANAVGTFGVIVSGKLRRYPAYNLYTGNYAEGGRCNIAGFYDEFPDRLPVDVVAEPVLRALSGDAMSYDECRTYCLLKQVEFLRSRWYVKTAEFLAAPLRSLNLALLAHKRRG